MKQIPKNGVKEGFKFLYWTPSVLSTYIDCPRKFKLLYIDGLKLPESQFMSFGKAFHLFAKYVCDCLFMNESEIGLDRFINDFKSKNPQYYQFLNRVKEFKQLAENLYDRVRSLRGVKWQIWKTELPLEYKFPASYTVDKIQLRGRIDFLVKHNEKLFIFDWKTGKIYDYNDKLQAVAFAYATLVRNCQELDPISGIRFIYFSCKTKEEKEFHFNKNEFPDFESETQKLIEKIISDKIFEPNERFCNWCGLEKECKKI